MLQRRLISFRAALPEPRHTSPVFVCGAKIFSARDLG
jgi:hypothetical protein